MEQFVFERIKQISDKATAADLAYTRVFTDDLAAIVAEVERLRVILHQLIHAAAVEMSTADSDDYTEDEKMDSLKELAEAIGSAQKAIDG